MSKPTVADLDGLIAQCQHDTEYCERLAREMPDALSGASVGEVSRTLARTVPALRRLRAVEALPEKWRTSRDSFRGEAGRHGSNTDKWIASALDVCATDLARALGRED